MFLRQLVDRLRQSLWFLPSVAVVAAAVLSVVLVQVDRITPDFATQYPLVFGGGPEGARGMLQAIASTVIAAAATTFSVTIVALTLTSSQFSPRVLRTFMGDRANQLVLATFMATFTYSILVLRTIRSADENGAGAFVPSVAVTAAILLAVLSLAMLIYFIHHIATRIQVSQIAAAVANEAIATIDRTYPESGGGTDERGVDDPAEPRLVGQPATLRARRSGYLADFDADALVAAGSHSDAVIRLEARPGEWVQRDVTLFSIWPAEAATDELGTELDRHLTLSSQRSMSQDVGFGIQQLVDIGTKALSPGINDPTTAITCLDRLCQILVELGGRDDRPAGRSDDDGRLRLIAELDDWEALVSLAFDQLRHFATGIPVVTAHLVRTLNRVRVGVPAHRHPPLVAQARAVAEGMSEIQLAIDRSRVQRQLDAFESADTRSG
jgi:uncharacterized membrane protein